MGLIHIRRCTITAGGAGVLVAISDFSYEEDSPPVAVQQPLGEQRCPNRWH